MRPQLALVGLVALLAACSPVVGVLDAEGDGGAGDALAGDVAALDAFESGGDSALVVDAPAGDAAAEASAPRICANDGDCGDSDPCTMRERCDPATRTCTSSRLDGDGDGYVPIVCGGDDCDDGDARVHPIQYPHCALRGSTATDTNCNGIADSTEPGQVMQRCLYDFFRLTEREAPDGGRWEPAECVAAGSSAGCRACSGRYCICWDSGQMTSRACSRM